MFLGLYNFFICSIGHIFSSVCMHMLAYTYAIQLHVSLFCVSAVGFFLRKNTTADEDDHAPHATINFKWEDGEVVLLHYLKTQHELLKKKYSTVKQASNVISPLLFISLCTTHSGMKGQVAILI